LVILYLLLASGDRLLVSGSIQAQPITNNDLLWSFLQLRSLFRNNCPFDWTDLQANPAVNTGCEVNPVPIRSLGIFTGAGVNAGNWAGIDAIGDTFAGIGNNGM
jgi:hypothetical protein